MLVNLDALVNTPVLNVFGTTATARLAGFPDLDVTGVYDDRYYMLNDEGQIGGSSLVVTFEFREKTFDPALFGLTALVPSGITLTIDVRGRVIVYTMTDLKPTGEGMVSAILERADA